MAISLNYIDINSINQTIQTEHETWVKKNAPSFLDFIKIVNQQYSILNFPELWSGARLFETKIEKKGKDSPASVEITEVIKTAQKKYKDDPLKIKEINDFEKKYTKYLALLKERCLLHAIAQTLYEINRSKKQKEAQLLEEIKQDFQKTLNISALLNMQTRQDCLKAHKQITMLAYALRNKADDNEQEKIIQLEVLSKRLLDCHYEGTKKSTLREALANDLSTITSFIGLGVGIPAAILAIAGIFFPPLLPIAGILGTIGFISYTASAISVVKMANEAISYGRGPSPSDVKWMIFDIVLAPFYIVGGQIFSGLSHALKNLKPLRNIVKATGDIWNNIVSNVFPDIFFVKDISSEMISVGSVYTAAGELKNTLSATSWKKMRSAFSAHDHDFLDKINHAKEKIALLNKSKARPIPTPQQKKSQETLKEFVKSDIAAQPQMQEIKAALEKYIKLEESIDYTIKYLLPEQYEREIYKKDLALEAIELACDKCNKSNPSNEQLQWSNQIKQLANQIDLDLMNEYTIYNNLISESSTTALNGRDFAYTKINIDNKPGEEPITVIKSFHAHILLWDSGFIGITTSKEAQKIKDAIEVYKNLPPDTSMAKRLESLCTIQDHCNTYLTIYKNDHSKGRYKFVEHLATNIEKELNNLCVFITANKEDSNDATPVLIGFKASG